MPYTNYRNTMMHSNVTIKLFLLILILQDNNVKLIHYLKQGRNQKQNSFIWLHWKKDQMTKITFRNNYQSYEALLYILDNNIKNYLLQRFFLTFQFFQFQIQLNFIYIINKKEKYFKTKQRYCFINQNAENDQKIYSFKFNLRLMYILFLKFNYYNLIQLIFSHQRILLIKRIQIVINFRVIY
ncbi:unnamed protein product [Paramecium pentaurelia]|uniref:Uncharacterized protein n=1 Tax=Paramecium pentaurelia TaxID=43138 RepID=A0A8S1YHG4_9CILI|nr:unnamed protein product [Paramecium pentaurelia]